MQQRLERNAALGRADVQAVLGGDDGDIIGHHEPAAAGHVAHDHLRIAGDVLADVLGDEAGVDVIAAAGGQADVEGDGLVLEEFGRALGEGRPRNRRRPHAEHCGPAAEMNWHDLVLS